MSMKVWDVRCTNADCGYSDRDRLFADFDAPTGQCPQCHFQLAKVVSFRGRHNPAWHPSSRVVLFRGPNGDVKYPGRADSPMPQRYRDQGFERVELSSLAEVTAHEKSTGTLCEAMHWDSNGKTDREDTPVTPHIEYSDLLS